MASEDELQAEVSDIRPRVSVRPGRSTTWLFAISAVLAAALLFQALEARRQSTRTPVVTGIGTTDTSRLISSPAPLQLPLYYDDYAPRHELQLLGQPEPGTPPALSRSTNPRLSSASPPYSVNILANPELALANAETAGASISRPFVAATTVYDAPIEISSGEAKAASGKSTERVTATYFQNPGTTVPKGTVIQCVMETALDSTRAGFARAIVSRDVYGFDGKEVLVAKGSRLVGEYKADIASGQKRALIQWQRLMRPDGVIINIDSPSADPLGRAGIKGKVDSHFFERFNGAILQSVLDIGVQLATRRVSRDGVIVALPGSAQNLGVIAPDKIQPTLKIRQGASVSVFVSRDLDFSTVSK